MISKNSTKLSSQSGIGLVEAMLTFVVLAFLLTGIVGWQTTNSWTIANANSREVATYKAQRILDSLQGMGIHNLVASDTLSCKDNNEIRNYYCSWTSRTLDSVFMLIKSDSSVAISKEIEVSVRWEIKGTPHTIKVTGAVQ
jgi:hypothetical protein